MPNGLDPLFADRFTYALSYANRLGCMLGVVRIAPDSATNSTMAEEIVARLALALREIDIVGHAGGDFMIVVAALRDRAAGMVVVDKLREVLSDPFDGGPIAFAIGISFYPPHGHDPETLLRTSAEALAVARARGSEVAVFGDES